MIEMVIMKWLLFLVMIARTKGYPRWESRNSSVSEEVLKTILESCYKNTSSSNPVFIFGDFNKFIDGVSIIRINDSLHYADYIVYESLKFKASSIVLMEEPPRKLLSSLKLLRRKKLWNNLTPFFIIGTNTASCEFSKSVLRGMQRMEVLNPIYICAKSINNTSEIYTVNMITNYAPHPWERIEELNDVYGYRQNFDANISCTHLTYDKTKILNGYDIVVVDFRAKEVGAMQGINYFEDFARFKSIDSSALATIIKALNASGQMEFERGMHSMLKRYHQGAADIMFTAFAIGEYTNNPFLFPHRRSELVALVKLKSEVSTFDKIRRLWSTPVLIAAAISLAVFFLILMMKRWSFGFALLDVTRLLTYTSIRTDNNYQSFRIYFTTMLIFIVIGNSVFQGTITTFLTTREKRNGAESIDELRQLGYQMYTHREFASWAKAGCPRCKFEKISTFDECIELVLNGTKSVCVIDKSLYEASKYILLPLDRLKEPLHPTYATFNSRRSWPLHDRFNAMMVRLIESGLIDFWEMEKISILMVKRQSMEAQWSSAQYRPVKFFQLAFAFQLWAAGLSLAIFVFFLEFCFYYVNP